MQGSNESESRRGQFLWRSGADRDRKVQEIARKVKEGHFFKDEVLGSLVDKISGHFESVVQEL